MKEIFKDVKGYEGLYQVSNLGRVKSMGSKFKRKEKFLKPGKDESGYLLVILYKSGVKETRRVHRIVAITFIPNPKNKKTVNHINGVKADNRADNLEWNTYSENHSHAYKTGLKNSLHCKGKGGCNTGTKQHLSKLTEKEVLQIRDLAKSKRFKLREIGQFYNCHQGNIYKISVRKTWKHI